MKEVKKYLDILDTWECNFLLCIFTFCKILQMCKEVTDITSYCGLIKKTKYSSRCKIQVCHLKCSTDDKEANTYIFNMNRFFFKLIHGKYGQNKTEHTFVH